MLKLGCYALILDVLSKLFQKSALPCNFFGILKGNFFFYSPVIDRTLEYTTKKESLPMLG